MLTHLDLFSGIGGFALAAQWAGYRTVQFVELEPFCQKVLAKNFPGVPIHDDIRQFDAKPFRETIDLLTGGFPCQDISVAGKQVGLSGERSGLWFEMLRVIEECRPRFILVENVPNLRTQGADTVLAGLEEAGYTAEPHVVAAKHIGATQIRERVWIVGYDNRSRELQPEGRFCEQRRWIGDSSSPLGVPNCFERRRKLQQPSLQEWKTRIESQGTCRSLPIFPPGRNDFRAWATVASLDASLMPCVEREICDMVDGLSTQLVRRRRKAILKGLGNAIVPQVAYQFIRAFYVRELSSKCE